MLAYLHGDNPLAHWARRVEAGDRFYFAGPSRSLVMPSGALTLVGDETSIAVAASYARTRPGQVGVVIEAEASAALEEVFQAVGLDAARAVPREPGVGRGQALAQSLNDAQGAVGITGGAELVQRVREHVRELGSSAIKTKTYWIEGRAGLD